MAALTPKQKVSPDTYVKLAVFIAGGVAVAFEVIASAVGVAHDLHPPVRARADLSIPAICRIVCHQGSIKALLRLY